MTGASDRTRRAALSRARRSRPTAVNSTPPHACHIPSPRALDPGKAAATPAFVARAQAGTSETPFGRLASDIAKTKKSETSAPTPPDTTAPTTEEV
jgi:hypothetical protein